MKQAMKVHHGANAGRYRLILDAAAQKHVKLDTLYKYQLRGNALLVDPVNGNPFVVVDHTPTEVRHVMAQWIISVHTFDSEPRSGTDKLRARAAAQMFFDAYCEGIRNV